MRLDELYKMVAYIYGDKNLTRTTTATFAHFVEVCGMLTIHDRKKKREGIGDAVQDAETDLPVIKTNDRLASDTD
jgi:hypothetical protein